MVIVRTNEPVYRYLMKKEIRAWFGLLTEKDEFNDFASKTAV